MNAKRCSWTLPHEGSSWSSKNCFCGAAVPQVWSRDARGPRDLPGAQRPADTPLTLPLCSPTGELDSESSVMYFGGDWADVNGCNVCTPNGVNTGTTTQNLGQRIHSKRRTRRGFSCETVTAMLWIRIPASVQETSTRGFWCVSKEQHARVSEKLLKYTSFPNCLCVCKCTFFI